MLTFLREYYRWILVPFFLTLLSIGVALYMAENSGDSDQQGFSYSMF